MPKGVYNRAARTTANDLALHPSASVVPPTQKRKATRRRKMPRAAAPAPTATIPTEDEGEEPITLTAKTQKLIEAVRVPFRSFTDAALTFTTSRADLATPFGKAFLAFKTDTTLGLADFSRQFDATVPADTAGYKAHKVYQSADYLMRLYRAQHRPKADPNAVKPASQADAVARLIRTVLPLIGADQMDKLWAVVESELNWSGQRLANLQTRTTEATPLLDVRAPRGITVPQLRIAAPRHAEPGEDTELARTGTHG